MSQEEIEALEDEEDARLGAEALERFRSGKERSYSLEELMEELGLHHDVPTLEP